MGAAGFSCFIDCISLCESCPYFRRGMHREYGNFSTDHISIWPINMTANVCYACSPPPPARHLAPFQHSIAPHQRSIRLPCSIQSPSKRNWFAPQQKIVAVPCSSIGSPSVEELHPFHHSSWLPLTPSAEHSADFSPEHSFSRAVGSPEESMCLSP